MARLAQIETDHAKWVRFLYCYPNKVTQKLLDTIAEHAALVKYIDMPLQHASASVLKRMKRGANGDIFLKLLERIRRTIPGVAIRTSMIVGFPGETEADFKELCDFVEAAQFDRMGAFSYSDEDTSKSFALDAKVDGRTIQNRKRRLMAIQRKISRTRNRTLVGREMDVAHRGPLRRFRIGLAGETLDPSPGYRWRLLHFRPRRSATAGGRVPPHANHQGARLRSDGRTGGRPTCSAGVGFTGVDQLALCGARSAGK